MSTFWASHKNKKSWRIKFRGLLRSQEDFWKILLKIFGWRNLNFDKSPNEKNFYWLRKPEAAMDRIGCKFLPTLHMNFSLAIHFWYLNDNEMIYLLRAYVAWKHFGKDSMGIIFQNFKNLIFKFNLQRRTIQMLDKFEQSDPWIPDRRIVY